jgi:hypothetical protein
MKRHKTEILTLLKHDLSTAEFIQQHRTKQSYGIYESGTMVARGSHPAEVLPILQPTFTRRTSGHCLGTFIAINLCIFLLGLYVVPHTVPPQFYLLVSLSPLKGLKFLRVNNFRIN